MQSRSTIGKLVLVLLSVGALACTPARRQVETDVVRSVSFEGNGGLFAFDQSDYRLAAQMEQEDSPFGVTLWPLMYVVDPAAYHPDALGRDAYRIEAWYAHNGWFDARFGGWEVTRVRPRGARRAGVVDILGHVDPGEPSLVRDFEITGLDRPGLRPLRGTIQRTGWIAEGVRFELAAVEATQERLRALLADHGFPHARVGLGVDAWPADKAVDVSLEVEPGVLSRFGPIEIEGNDAVPEEVIRDTLTFEAGETYNASTLRRTQRRLFGLQTFSVVNLIPDLSDPERGEVPITVDVAEASFRTARLGGGLTYQAGTFTPRISASYRHVNLFHRLVRLDTEGSIGVAISPRLGFAPLEQWIYRASVDVSSGRLLGGTLFGVGLGAEMEQDVQAGQYIYYNPRLALNLRYTPSETVVATLGPQWELYGFRGLDEEGQLLAQSIFGEGFRDPYQLTTLGGSLTVDWRDDPLFTTRGAYHTATLRQAFPLIEGVDRGYFFTGISADARTYKRLRTGRRAAEVPFTFAGRIQGEWLQAWNDQGVPYPSLAFLGGASNLRGYLLNQVGPYDLLCTRNPSGDGDPFTGEPGAGTDTVRRYLPRGGRVLLAAQGELRYSLSTQSRVVAFLDAGVLEQSLAALSADSLRWGAGVGARYDTPVGPIRLDFAVRPIQASDAGPVNTPGCGPGDVQRRAFDVASVLRPRLDIRDRFLPFAVNVYIAIGEAF